MPDKRLRPHPRDMRAADAFAITLAVVLIMMFASAVLHFGVAESERRIACALSEAMRTRLPTPDRCR